VKYEDETANIISVWGTASGNFLTVAAGFQLPCERGRPRVVYRETIQKKVEIEVYLKRTWRKKHFGPSGLPCPRKRGSGNDCIMKLDDSVIPHDSM
jgi:elongation factor G